MYPDTRKLQIIIFAIAAFFALSLSAQAQTVCPAGMICLTQAEANAARNNALELAATKEKVTTLESVIADKDKTIAENKEAAAKNEADLKAANVKLLTDVAEKTGQIIECKADKVMYVALIEYLTKNQRQKKIGLINLF